MRLPLAGAVALLCTLLAAGCGSHKTDSEAGLRLQREYLIVTVRAIDGVSGAIAAEAVATKAAWPLVANGLRASIGAAGEAKIAAAAAAAAARRLPALFGERESQGLTGPASSIVGEFRTFAALSKHGWQMIAYALQRERGGGGAGRFARATVALYIDSVYDAHFGLAQIGKKIIAGWKRLGGTKEFGSALPEAEVQRLSSLYSEQSYRLYPHATVKLGS